MGIRSEHEDNTLFSLAGKWSASLITSELDHSQIGVFSTGDWDELESVVTGIGSHSVLDLREVSADSACIRIVTDGISIGSKCNNEERFHLYFGK